MARIGGRSYILTIWPPFMYWRCERPRARCCLRRMARRSASGMWLRLPAAQPAQTVKWRPCRSRKRARPWGRSPTPWPSISRSPASGPSGCWAGGRKPRRCLKSWGPDSTRRAGPGGPPQTWRSAPLLWLNGDGGRPGRGRHHRRGGRSEIIGVHDHGRGVLQIVHGLLDQFPIQFLLNIRPHFDEGILLPRFDLNNVISELALHRFAELAHGNREGHLLEGRHHASLSEGPQVAAVGAGTRVVGFSLGQRGEIRAIQQLLPDLLCLGQCFFVGQFLPAAGAVGPIGAAERPTKRSPTTPRPAAPVLPALNQ